MNCDHLTINIIFVSAHVSHPYSFFLIKSVTPAYLNMRSLTSSENRRCKRARACQLDSR